MTEKVPDLNQWMIAYYLCQGWKPTAIAKKLGIHDGTVSKLIADLKPGEYMTTAFNAAKAPWPEMQLHLLPVTADHLSLKQLLNDKKLSEQLSKESFADILKQRTTASNLTEVIVCSSAPAYGDWNVDDPDPDSHRRAVRRAKNKAMQIRPVTPKDWEKDDPKTWQLRLAVFGRAAAPHVNHLLQHSRVAGVSWGSSIGCVIDELHRQRIALPERHLPIETVATVGEAIGDKDAADEISSSRLARRLKEAIGHRRTDKVHHLRGIPAMLPFSYQDVPAARKGLLGYPNYKQVFGESGALSRLDTVLTSVGNVNQAHKFYPRELRTSPFSESQISLLDEYGDIGGALIPFPARTTTYENADAKNIVNQVSARWTGMTFDDYQQLAKAYGPGYVGRPKKGQRPPGVVVLAIGRNKRGVVLQCLQQDVINVLIIDEDLAFALLESTPNPHTARR